MKKSITTALLMVLVMLAGFDSQLAARPTGNFHVDLTDERRIFQTDFGTNMVLRVVKDSSVQHRDYGWILEVYRKPFRNGARNLIYTNKTGTTADRSQFYAWQVNSREYPNYRVFLVGSTGQMIRAELIQPRVEGTGENARFVSGKLQISWTH